MRSEKNNLKNIGIRQLEDRESKGVGNIENSCYC